MAGFTSFGGGTLASSTTTSTRNRIPSFHRAHGLSLIAEDPIYYSTRGWAQRLTTRISRYTHEIRALGGYWSAGLSINDSPRNIERWISYGLGRHIYTLNPSLCIAWEGFVNKITANLGPFQYEIGPLLDIGNRVATTYSLEDASTNPPTMGGRYTTAVANNTDSQARFGVIEKFYSINGATQTVAEQIRDSYLNDPKYAYPATSRQTNLSGNSGPSVNLECLGYWHWLKAFYPTIAGTGYIDLDTKIQNVLEESPNAIFSTDYAMVAANGTLVKTSASGEQTAEDLMKNMVTMGDSANNTYTMGFYGNRQLIYQPAPTAIEYQQRISSNKGLVNGVNREIRPWDAQAGKYILFPDFLIGQFPPTTTTLLGNDPRVGFVEVARFTAPYGLNLDGKQMSQLDQRLARRSMGSMG